MILHPLKPIVNQQSKVLILGSFPSVKSRAAHGYYANPQNRFWTVMERVFNDSCIDQEAFILKHHLALWDVIASCDLKNSDDSTIKNIQVNPLEDIIKDSAIQCIVLNGKKAESCFKKYFGNMNIQVVSCPSTSSANAATSLDELVEHYKIVRGIQ